MDVLDLYAKISLDKSEYDKGLDEASSESKSFGSKLAGGLSSAVKTVAKVGAAAVAAGASAAAAITKQAVSSFADYEQLVGGVETLFGAADVSLEEFAKQNHLKLDEAGAAFEQYQNRAQTVLDNANNAYKTAGLSANEYMETVTSFAASLNASLGDNAWQSANYADMAITDMADNANKMGTSMESIQNAYMGFSKQNFTMLDNLKLGYGGTKEEMERLMRDAEKLEGYKVGSLDMNSFADVVDAIHIVQENLGITGTTAKEASTTISGSLATMQSAWQNTLAAIGEGDMSKISTMIDNLVESATTFAGNVMPVVQRALEGISQLITELAPEIAAALPDMITTVLPSLLDAGVQIIQSLGEGILKAIPELLPTITEVILQLAQMLVENLPQLIEVGLQVILQLALGIAQALPELIPAIVDTVLTIAEYLIDNVDLLIDAAIALIIGLADGLISALPKLIEKAPEIVIKLVEAIIRNAPKILEAATSLIFKLIEGIVNLFGKIAEVGGQLVDKVKSGFSQKVQDAKNWGRDIIQNFIDGIKEKWEHLKQTVSNVAQTVKDFLGFSEPEKGPLSNFHTYAPDMMDLFAKGIRDNENVVTDQIAKSFDFGNITGNVNVSGTASGINGGFDTVLQRIEALLAQYLPQVQKDIVLDTGALVGGTVAAYDEAFGTRSNRGSLR